MTPVTAWPDTLPQVTVDEQPVRDEERYGVYELARTPAGLEPRLVAATSRAGIGTCLVTLAEDRREAGVEEVPVLAILDRQEREWITSLWRRENL